MDKDTEKELRMNSPEWQKRIADLESEIAAQEARLAMLAHAKAAAITDHKRLMTLEQEEMGLPDTIEALTKRLPLLNQELERALKTEAELRLRELAPQGAEATNRITQSTTEIRAAMRALLELIARAHADWEARAALVAEGEFLHVRFELPRIEIPREDRVSPEQQHAFLSEYRLLLRHVVVAQPWIRMLSDWRELERRTESQRRADEFKERSTGPHYQPIRTVQHAESR